MFFFFQTKVVTRQQAKATANRQNRLKGTNGAEEREKRK